jgi:hypothetical protein
MRLRCAMQEGNQFTVRLQVTRATSRHEPVRLAGCSPVVQVKHASVRDLQLRARDALIRRKLGAPYRSEPA